MGMPYYKFNDVQLLMKVRLGKICAMAALTAHSAELTSLLKSDQKPHSTGPEVAINIAFIVLTTLSHCLGVKVGQLPRTVWHSKLISLSCTVKSSESLCGSK